MGLLKETTDVCLMRNNFFRIIAQGNCPAMCKMKYWAQLKNAVVREAFRKIGQTAPYEALEELGLTPPRTLRSELRLLKVYWKKGQISAAECAALAHALREDMLTLYAHGDVNDTARTLFEADCTATVNQLTAYKEAEKAEDK